MMTSFMNSPFLLGDSGHQSFIRNTLRKMLVCFNVPNICSWRYLKKASNVASTMRASSAKFTTISKLFSIGLTWSLFSFLFGCSKRYHVTLSHSLFFLATCGNVLWVVATSIVYPIPTWALQMKRARRDEHFLESGYQVTKGMVHGCWW